MTCCALATPPPCKDSESRGRQQVFLYRARRNPPYQFQNRAGLVVGAAGPSAAERLLAHDSARRPVVDVEISGRLPQRGAGVGNGRAILGENGSRQSVARRAVDELEDLLASGRRRRRIRSARGRRVPRASSRGSAPPPASSVGSMNQPSPSPQLAPASTRTPESALRSRKVAFDAPERALVDDCAHEVAEVRRVAHADFREHGQIQRSRTAGHSEAGR